MVANTRNAHESRRRTRPRYDYDRWLATRAACELARGNLHEVFGERDAKKRRAAIAQLWTEDCVFIDHSGMSHGRDELDRAVAVLHQRLPGYVFSELRPVDVLHESGRLAWSYGRPGQEPIKGVDVVLVQDGRISLMLTFLDEVPAKL